MEAWSASGKDVVTLAGRATIRGAKLHIIQNWPKEEQITVLKILFPGKKHRQGYGNLLTDPIEIAEETANQLVKGRPVLLAEEDGYLREELRQKVEAAFPGFGREAGQNIRGLSAEN